MKLLKEFKEIFYKCPKQYCFESTKIKLAQGFHVRISKYEDGQDSDDLKQGTADMTIFVQNLLQQMQSRFQTMSESIVSKIDEMGGRINELEQSISDLRTEIGAEGSPSPLPPSKKADEAKPEEGSA